MQKGRSAVGFGNLDLAASSFKEAEARFQAAEEGTHTSLFKVTGAIPVLGRTADVVRDLALAGEQLAQGGTRLVEAVASLPDGLGSLAPRGGRLPIEALAGLADDVAAAEESTARAAQIVMDSPSSMLLGPVAEARRAALDQVVSADRALSATRDILERLPDFAGANGTRHYFFGAINPAEQRGAGGIMGAYSILTVEGGRLSFSPFHPVQSLPSFDPDQVAEPSPGYRRNYNQYGGAGDWLDANMTPDFPSAARAAMATYERAEGLRLDGMLTADPYALQAMLEITGPARIPSLGIRIDASNVVDFLANEAFSSFPGPIARKEVLGGVAKDVFDRFLGMDDKGIARLRAIAKTVAAGHIQVYSADPVFQEGLSLAGVSGAFAMDGPGDFASVSINSRSGAKVDYYASRSVSYSVLLGGEHEAIATTDLVLTNDAPPSGQPRYVIGPNVEGAEPGDQISLVTFACPASCELADAERSGERISMRTGSELGLTWYQDFFTIPSGESASISVQTKQSGVWEGNSSAGSYRLTLLGQATIRPTDVTIQITSPAGTHITWTSEPMQVDGDTATWRGTPGRQVVIEVRFQASPALGLWRELMRL